MPDHSPESVGRTGESSHPRVKEGRSSRRLWLVCLVGGGIVVGVIVAACLLLKGRWDRDRALSLARRGDFAAAEAVLKNAAERDPTDLEVIMTLARGYLDAGEPAKASPLLTRWCELRPQQGEPAELRFRAALQLGLPEAALEAGRHLLSLDPTNGTVRTQVAQVCLSLGRFDEAERECRRSLQDTPGEPVAQVVLAKALSEKGDRAAAEALVEDLLARRVTTAEVLMLRAVLYLDADQPDKAVPVLRQLVDGWPGQKRFALYQLVIALKRAGLEEEAARQEHLLRELQDVEVLLQDSNSNPHNLPLRVRAAEALFAADREREAVALLQAALERDPRYPEAHRLLAAWFEKAGQPVKAAHHRRLAEGSP
jgi:predicted Zn-dependent protease